MLAAPETIRFGQWRMDLQRRVLIADGQPVALNGRAFDMLALLVARRGEVLSRDEIVSHVWQGLAVGDNNLTVQMHTLRRALGEHGDAGLVVTVPGRGYRFVGEVKAPAAASPPPELLVEMPRVPTPRIEPWLTRAFRWRHIALVSLTLLMVIGGLAGLTWRPPPAPRLSIAVLPLRNLSADHTQDHLADALTDDLTTDLAHIPQSTVIARESTEVWRSKPASAQTIGRALGVRYLVEGSVRFDDDRFRVNAQLVDASTGAQTWTDRFDTSSGKMADVRDAIVRHLASSLDFQLAQIESARSLKDRPDDPDALDLFFRARAIVNTDMSLAGLTNAQAKLESALNKQPDFADALAELGTVLLMKVEDMVDPDETKDMQRARKVIAQALALSPRNADALAARARELAGRSQWMEAVYSAKAALAVEPSNVAADVVLARCARARGELNLAASYMLDVLRIIPDSLTNKRRFLILGYIRLLQGQAHDAIDLLQRSIAGDPENSRSDVMGRIEVAHLLLVAAAQMSGDKGRAHSMYLDYARHWPHRSAWRFAQYYGHDESRLPGFTAMLAALHAAGMPMYADEEPDITTPQVAACHGDDFAPTPRSFSQGETWNTDALASALSSRSPPIVIDISYGAAIPDGASWLDWSEDPESAVEFARHVVDEGGRAHTRATVVVMGDGRFGCVPYDVASRLVEDYPNLHVVWYRGGEEAWAARNLPHIDARR